MSSPSHQSETPPQATSPVSTVETVTTATSLQNCQHDSVSKSSVEKPKGDFFLDTFFNPVWMSGPHVFSFSKDGTVSRPETYEPEPYPGYNANCPGHFELEDEVSSLHDLSETGEHCKDSGPPERDVAEFAAFMEKAMLGAQDIWQRYIQYWLRSAPLLRGYDLQPNNHQGDDERWSPWDENDAL